MKGRVVKRVNGKTVGDPGERFVGCADLIETYHYPLTYFRPLPQVPYFPFVVHRFTVCAN